ncbi:MAG: hypothetical protein U0893_06555 [Chloroflexota bacterium]
MSAPRLAAPRRTAAVRGAWTPLMLAAAALLAVALRQICDQPIVYDALGYVLMGKVFATGRIDGQALIDLGWIVRTCGYPVFLAPFTALAGANDDVLEWLVFAGQLAIDLAASWSFARRVALAFGDARWGRWTLAVVALNPFQLILTGLLLADFLSSASIAVAVALLLPPRETRPSARVLRDGVLALVCLSLAAEIRPANAVLLPVGGLLWAIQWLRAARGTTGRLELGRLFGGLVLVGVATLVPMAPQIALNWMIYGVPHPFVVGSLYETQLRLGLPNLKVIGLVPWGYFVDPTANYQSPFGTDQGDLPRAVSTVPLGVIGTYALHVFALLDQDYPFPYVREIDAWHRWPLSTVNYLFLGAVVVGQVVGWRRWCRPGSRLAWSVVLVMTLAYAGISLPTRVECRSGLPLFTLLAPAAAGGLLAVWGWYRQQAWRRLAGGLAVILLVMCASGALSVWMQAQAPKLVMLREFLRQPGPATPAVDFEIDPPDQWVVDQKQTYHVRATNVGERTWYAERPAGTFLHVMFVRPAEKPGERETIDGRAELVLPIERVVRPGETLEMDVTATAPRKEGGYVLRHQLELDKDWASAHGDPFETLVDVDVRRSGGRSPGR